MACRPEGGVDDFWHQAQHERFCERAYALWSGKVVRKARRTSTGCGSAPLKRDDFLAVGGCGLTESEPSGSQTLRHSGARRRDVWLGERSPRKCGLTGGLTCVLLLAEEGRSSRRNRTGATLFRPG
jgi:hypothetical protein